MYFFFSWQNNQVFFRLSQAVHCSCIQDLGGCSKGCETAIVYIFQTAFSCINQFALCAVWHRTFYLNKVDLMDLSYI
jgi:hypothetical protein